MPLQSFKKKAPFQSCLMARRMPQRSKGTTVFGLLLILSSFIQMHKLIVDVQWYAEVYSYLPAGLIATRYYFSWLQRVIGILVGVGLLSQQEIARKTGIALGWFTILTIYWKHPYPAFKLHTQYLNQRFGSILAQSGTGMTFPDFTLLAMIVQYLGDIIFWSSFIYFFTRPSVKSQFNANI